MCLLGYDIYEYNYVSQGKITIPNVDDDEELQLTDVSESVNPVVAAQELLILQLGRLVNSSFRSFWRHWPFIFNPFLCVCNWLDGEQEISLLRFEFPPPPPLETWYEFPIQYSYLSVILTLVKIFKNLS